MRGQPRDHTLQASALVNEAFLRLHGALPRLREEHTSFLAQASAVMRSVLVDHARRRQSLKRAPPGSRVPMDEILLAYEDGAIDVLALHEALERLTAFAPDMARAVELRFFGGLAVETVASQLGIDLRSFERRWRAARAWLRAELG
jgi:RNA polymerase sigma factor (TIGR02999 family)